jgi:hypothetical protein
VPQLKQRTWPKDWRKPLARLRQSVNARLGIPHVFDFTEVVRTKLPRRRERLTYPCVIHAWDNTPRAGQNGVAYRNPDPAHFRTLLTARRRGGGTP